MKVTTHTVLELSEHVDFIHLVIDPESRWVNFVGDHGDIHSYDLATEEGRRWCANDWPAEWQRAKGKSA